MNSRVAPCHAFALGAAHFALLVLTAQPLSAREAGSKSEDRGDPKHFDHPASPTTPHFSGSAKPLDPAAHPLHTDPINRARVYDFYAKQALDWLADPLRPVLLPPFPGLDGGTIKRSPRPRHFGNLTEAMWDRDDWNLMDSGTVQSYGLSVNGKPRPRLVSVRIGDVAAAFDPDTLTWPLAWRGGMLTRDTQRFGFLAAARPAGTIFAAPEGEPAPRGSFTYRGYYRYGERAVFAYAREGVEWLETVENEDGGVIVRRERKGDGPLTELTRGGPAQWPNEFPTKGQLGTGKPYAFDELVPPSKTPWHTLWHFGDHDFLPNGDAALCTIEGDVWIVAGLDDTLSHLTWRRFAAGLHQPLGLRVIDGNICVLGRDQITRLHDLNGDGEADYYENLCNAYDSVASGHIFFTGLQCDDTGRFIFVSGLQGVVRTTADGKSVEVLATGLRNPNGLGLGPHGEIAVAPQEGEWTPSSMVCEFQPDVKAVPFFGYGGPKKDPGVLGYAPPLVFVPRGEDNSSGGLCYVEGDRWGVPAGTLVHFSYGMGTAFLVLHDRVDGTAQGTVVPLPGNFRSGAHRGRFHPRDRQLYVTGITGWVTYTPDPGCFTRVRYTGDRVQVPRTAEAHDNGVLLRFAEQLDPSAKDVQHFFAQEWNYRYSASYGSEEYSVRSPEQPGHDVLAITRAHLLADGCSVFLEIPQLQPANVLHLHCELPGLLTRSYYLTVHNLGPAFIDFPGYSASVKTASDSHASHHPAPVPAAGATRPVKWEAGPAGRALHIRTAPGLQFEQRELRAAASERLSLTFENPDVMLHNWVLLDAGAEARVGALADALIAESDALARHYVPDSPDILCHTRLLEPRQSTTIHFTAPARPGRYPYICTFPGHWSIMRGVLVVE